MHTAVTVVGTAVQSQLVLLLHAPVEARQGSWGRTNVQQTMVLLAADQSTAPSDAAHSRQAQAAVVHQTAH